MTSENDFDCEEFVSALESSETDRVNSVIDKASEFELDQKVELYMSCHEELTNIYDREAEDGDGYVRQSVVRFLLELRIPLSMGTSVIGDEDRLPEGVRKEEVEEITQDLKSFFFEALQDSDGRVRRAAKRGVKNICLGYDMMGEKEPIEKIAEELSQIHDKYPESDDRSKHIREAYENACFRIRFTF